MNTLYLLLFLISPLFLLAGLIKPTLFSKSMTRTKAFFSFGFATMVFLVLFVVTTDPSQVTPTTTTSNTQTETVVKTEEVAKVVPPVEAIKVTAVALAKAYEENELKADRDYKDKLVEITGKIKDLGTMLSQTYIILSSEKDFSLTDIQCFIDDDNQAQIDKAIDLKKGDRITVQGVVEGKSLNVAVRKCEIR